MTARKRKQRSGREGTALRSLARWVFLLILMGGLAYGITDLLRFTMKSDLFLVRKVRIEGNKLLSDMEILENLDLPSRVRLWQVLPGRIEAKLLELPLVASVRVRRILPQTLVLDISERVPIADWSDPRTRKTYAVDEEGIILCDAREIRRRAAGVSDPSPFLRRRPSIEGLDIWGLMPGDVLDLEGLDRLLPALGLAVSRGDRWIESVRKLCWQGKRMGWVFRCEGPAAEVRLGRRRFVERIGDIGPLWRFLIRENVPVRYVDLRFEEQGIVVKPLHYDVRRWMTLASRYRRSGTDREGAV